MSTYFCTFLSVGNLKPKLKWFFKPKLKPKNVLLNFLPGPRLAMYDGLAQHKFQVINIVVLEHLDCRTGKPQTENERGVVFLVAENKGAF